MSLALDLLPNPSVTFICYLSCLCLSFLNCKMGIIIISTSQGVTGNNGIMYMEKYQTVRTHTRSGLGGSQRSVILPAALSRHHDSYFLWRTCPIPKSNYRIPLEWAVHHSTSHHGHSNTFTQQIFLEYLLRARHYYRPKDGAVNEAPDLMGATYISVAAG